MFIINTSSNTEQDKEKGKHYPRNFSSQTQSLSTYAAFFSKVTSQLSPHTCGCFTCNSGLNMCQILPHTTNLIFTKEAGLIATLPSRDETLKLQTLVHTTTEMWILFPPSLSFSACKARLLQEDFLQSKLQARRAVGLRAFSQS